jgi:PAS domain S-box-containing protein
MASEYLFWPSAGEPYHWFGLGAFLVTGGIIASICEAMKRAQRRAEQQARLLEERGITLQAHMREVEHHKQMAHESEERLRLAQQAGRIGSFEWNIQTGVNRWTPEMEALYGLATGTFPGTQQAWERLVHVEDRAEVLRKVQVAMETGSFEGEWRVQWPDGRLRWLAGRAWMFTDPSGKPLRLLGVNIDITERKHAEEALRQRETQLQKIVADLEASRAALGEKVQELEMLHDMVVGRELKMIDLEKELESLRARQP